MLRSRAMLISERLLSKENILMFVDESGIKAVISAIDERLSLLESQDADECECALEALAQIGSSTQGAVLLLSNASAARHVVNAAFDLHGRGKLLIRYDLEEQFRVYINTHFMMKIHTKLYLRDLMCTSQDLEGCKWKMSK